MREKWNAPSLLVASIPGGNQLLVSGEPWPLTLPATASGTSPSKPQPWLQQPAWEAAHPGFFPSSVKDRPGCSCRPLSASLGRVVLSPSAGEAAPGPGLLGRFQASDTSSGAQGGLPLGTLRAWPCAQLFTYSSWSGDPEGPPQEGLEFESQLILHWWGEEDIVRLPRPQLTCPQNGSPPPRHRESQSPLSWTPSS